MQTFTAIAAFSLLVGSIQGQQDSCPSSWKCLPTSTPPTLDGDLSDWSSVPGIESKLQGALTGIEYVPGAAEFQCQYDATHIYLALKIPGLYRFNATDNHHCAAVATMQKIGVDATFYNMGGCPDAVDGSTCDDALLGVCDAHRVDIGAHWELSGTQQGVEYPVGSTATTKQGTTTEDPPGDDPIANKDDEYAVSPYCRADDDDANAGNEWSGAWLHDYPVDGEFGHYVFELSRTLSTASAATDAQFTPGETHEFGVAFWDPYESATDGWSDAGHYVSGCMNWMELELTSSSAPASFYASLSLVAVATILAMQNWI